MKPSASTLTIALTATLGAVATLAADNPLALSPLSQGCGVAAADKAQDGKYGEC